ncbi:CPBP family glutamic-type intramembrane protease [Rheinheimera gaetbuli]
MVLIGAVKWVYPKILCLQRSQIALVPGSMLASAMLFSLLEAEQLVNSFSAGLWLWLWLWLACFITGFCIGIGQELLYRGILFSSLTRFMSVTLAGAVTTFAFVIAPLHSVRLWPHLSPSILFNRTLL